MSNWKKWMDENDAYAAAVPQMPHKVYDVDPYVLVIRDRDEPSVYHLFFDGHSKGTGTWMHLIVGEERALLIDTAYGVGDLKGLVEAITDRPVDVVNTHFHGDHSAGNGQFDRVYIHKYDAPYLRDCTVPGARRLLPAGDFYRPEDVVPIRETELVEIEEGHRFTLGPGRQVEVFHMPGHAAGGIMLLDRKTEMLFTGDAVLSTPTLVLSRFPNSHTPECLTIEAFRDALLHFLPQIGHVKALYPGHGRMGVDATQITDMLGCTEAILAEPEIFEEYDYVNDPSQRRIKCVGRAMVVYSADRVRRPR